MTVYMRFWKHPDRVQRIGLAALLLGVPLLLWQFSPGNQVNISQPAFLALHSLMEIFSVVVAALIFFTAYGTRQTVRSVRVIVLGCSFLAAALYDAFHMLSYDGMPALISENSPHKSILFWLCARYAAAVGLLLYVLLPESRPATPAQGRWLLLATLATVALFAYTIAGHHAAFPQMFVADEGLTPFKIRAEWLVFALYLGAAGLLYVRRDQVVNCDVGSLMLALLLMALGELFFTFYVHVTNSANLLGHAFKVLAYYFLYRAIFAEVVQRPYVQIRDMLLHDDLTGLASRMAFRDRLDTALDRVRREGGFFAVISLGLDHFKTVNATLGHERGDQLLVAVAGRIRANLPDSCFIARFSGDNFMILCEGENAERMRELGEYLLRIMGDGFSIGQDQLEITTSLGVVVYPADGDSASELLRNADVALHHAKLEGRDRMVMFSHQLSETIRHRASIESHLRHALERGELHLHYQPKVALRHGGIGGWETLLRWQSPELGAVSPLEFIPVAEDTGLILPIGEWVLRETCRQVAAWKAQGLAPGPVSVNLSTRQFSQQNLPDTITSILRESGLSGADISLEITESIIMVNPVSAAGMLRELAQIGIQTSVDDFGTGYSSLSYLKTFPINCLKIDRSFIDDVPTDENDVAIVRSVISLGHSLGLYVVAEGVETEAQLAFLCAEGCDAIQGYLYSRPLPPAEAEALLRSGRRLSLSHQHEAAW
ncbi:MAG: EAL domain-containing protein [Haliea sp.]